MRKTKWIWIWAAIGVVLAVVIFWPAYLENRRAIEEGNATRELIDSTELDQDHYKYGIPFENFDIEEGIVERNQNLSSILAEYGVSVSKIHEITQRCRNVFDVRKIRAGQKYTLFLDSLRSPEFFIYENNDREYVVIDFKESSNVYTRQKNVTVKEQYATVKIQSSPWNAFAEIGAPNLSTEIADIYAWSIDFFGLQKGDSIQLVYDESYVENKPLGDYKIKMAIFNHMGKDYYAFPFVQNDLLAYFDEFGNSLQKSFLKAPLKFNRISSGFSNNRYHPVLKRYRAHHGVDYAAPTGTPVYSIGDGTIIKKAYQAGGGGNYLSIKHNTIYSTTYMHLSKFANGVYPGRRVKQGEVIGYVGSTGLATGPHLDFRVYKYGTPINPLTMDSPPKNPILKENMPRFTQVKDSLIQVLTNLKTPVNVTPL